MQIVSADRCWTKNIDARNQQQNVNTTPAKHNNTTTQKGRHLPMY
jgi:hypothetical protein